MLCCAHTILHPTPHPSLSPPSSSSSSPSTIISLLPPSSSLPPSSFLLPPSSFLLPHHLLVLLLHNKTDLAASAKGGRVEDEGMVGVAALELSREEGHAVLTQPPHRRLRGKEA
eukprot:1318083-Rhodomonas_salina.1